MAKNVYVLGNSESVFLINLISNLKQNCDYNIIDLRKEMIQFKANHKKCFHIRKINSAYIYFRFFSSIRKTYKDNIINIHYLEKYFPFFNILVRFCFKKRIVTFWGSDLFCNSKKQLKKFNTIFKCATYISVATDEMRDFFLNMFPKYKSKIKYARFGLSELDEIDKINNEDLQEFKDKWHINNNDKKIVAIGYNKLREQQHLKVINSIPIDICNKIYVIIPWSYGFVDSEYIDEVKSALNERKLEYVLIDSFLTNQEIACLRKLVDYYIHVRETDALSGSLQEFLYAGASVICGNWLPYNILDNMGIEYLKVDSPEKSGDALSSLLHNNKQFSKEKNSKIISKLSKWNCNIQDWIALYN